MKYKDENGQWQDIILEPSGDTLPIGSIVDYDGEEVPYGYEKVEETPLIESGSNENGHYIKFSDGTLICRATKSEGTGNSLITFPVPFASTNYQVSIDPGYASSPNVVITWGAKTVNGFKFYTVIDGEYTEETVQSFDYTAIGKWK